MNGIDFLTDFWREKYLREYIRGGGSKIKFVTGRKGSGKTYFLNAMTAIAKEENYKTVQFSARDVWMHDFREIYIEILHQCDIMDCLESVSRYLIREMGYDDRDIPEGMRFIDFLSQNGMGDAITKREIRAQLRQIFLDNPMLDNNFALACSMLTGSILGYPVLEEQNKALLLAWLEGDRSVKLSQLRTLGFYPSRITKYNARHMLRSLAEVVRMGGCSGLLVAIDDMEILISRSSLEPIHYTKMKREDTYESIRQLIDDIDSMRNILFIYAFDRSLIDDENAGLKSYQALWMRIQNEIVSERFNCFADMVDMDRLSLQEYTPEVVESTGPVYDTEARHIIEALRSGVPSRAVGQYFSEARPKIMREISDRLDAVCDADRSSGMVICGKYGEGKTHLLNTVFNLAHSNNMVVSYISLSKETPMDKLYLVYQKIIQNTYLPRRLQPGFSQELEKISANSPIASEMLFFAAKQLETDKLYYLFRSYLNTEDSDEKFLLQADLEGDFMANAPIKKIYRRIFNQPVKYNVNFAKTKHCRDYFSFMSHLFVQLGYHGWVILVDETELMGRLGKKARLNAYRNMADFLMPGENLESTFSLFALSASYVEDVIDGKHEYENLEAVYPEEMEPAKTVLDILIKAPQLLPLSKEEISEILYKIQDFHGRAYAWTPGVSVDSLMGATRSGYLLRTKIRAAIEFLDQLYLYHQSGKTKINELGKEIYTEDVPSLEEIDI